MARNDAQMLVVPGPGTMRRVSSSEEDPKPTHSAEPVFCPNCGARLMPFDLKLNHCFRCNSVLDTEDKTPNHPGHDSPTHE